MANNFLPFCPTDTGTNLLSQGDYAVDSERTIGNQPGTARSQLVNKAMRQSAFMMSQLAEYASFKTGADTLDNGVTAQMLAILKCAFQPLVPEVTTYTSGSGNHNCTFQFFIATGSATVGATYTNNAVTFTVKETVASGLIVKMTGNAAPAVSGTLTKATGTGDATLTFYAVRAPIVLNVKAAGGGGGAGAPDVGTSAGGTGGTTTFGSTLISCPGGGGSTGGAGGNGGAGGAVPTITAPAYGRGWAGSTGNFGGYTADSTGGAGGTSVLFSSPAPGGGRGLQGGSAVANSGGGGGGGGGFTALASSGGGGGGSSCDVFIPITSTYTFAYEIGTAGTPGSTGGSGIAAGISAAGIEIVTEIYQ